MNALMSICCVDGAVFSANVVDLCGLNSRLCCVPCDPGRGLSITNLLLDLSFSRTRLNVSSTIRGVLCRTNDRSRLCSVHPKIICILNILMIVTSSGSSNKSFYIADTNSLWRSCFKFRDVWSVSELCCPSTNSCKNLVRNDIQPSSKFCLAHK